MPINIDRLSIEVLKNLDVYLANTVEDVEQAVKETAEETVSELNATSPKSKNGGDYAESWAKKRDRSIKGKWYNSMVVYSKAPSYRLTHLLEFGHAKRSGGRTAAIPHIRTAEENAQTRLWTKLIRKLRYGG